MNNFHNLFLLPKNKIGEKTMKEIVLEDVLKVDLTKDQIDDFFNDPINKQYQKKFQVYEKPGTQGSLFYIVQKNKYTKLYKDKVC